MTVLTKVPPSYTLPTLCPLVRQSQLGLRQCTATAEYGVRTVDISQTVNSAQHSLQEKSILGDSCHRAAVSLFYQTKHMLPNPFSSAKLPLGSSCYVRSPVPPSINIAKCTGESRCIWTHTSVFPFSLLGPTSRLELPSSNPLGSDPKV